MKVREFAPVEPLGVEPAGAYVGRREREEALRDALRGVELGVYDQRIVEWALRTLDISTLRTLISLIERARGAAMVEILDLETTLHRRRAEAESRHTRADFGTSDDTSFGTPWGHP